MVIASGTLTVTCIDSKIVHVMKCSAGSHVSSCLSSYLPLRLGGFLVQLLFTSVLQLRCQANSNLRPFSRTSCWSLFVTSLNNTAAEVMLTTSIQGYWLAIYKGISAPEHVIFKEGMSAYTPALYDQLKKLPLSFAALGAFLLRHVWCHYA